MKLADLDYVYPDELVATEPQRPSRVMWMESGVEPTEIQISDLLERIPSGDVLVVNDTKVLKRRIFSDDLEILFLKKISEYDWEVLFPSRKFKVGDQVDLPGGLSMTLIQKGRPQVVRLSAAVDEAYFLEMGELPLPPYIQRARDLRHTVDQDESWYQTAWAEKAGSFAAPTASLHFSAEDIETLRNKGVKVLKVTLHVGLGTFLPVTVEDLDQHLMHEEYAELSQAVWQEITSARAKGCKVWALGTTAVRTVESVAAGQLKFDVQRQVYLGDTKLLIQPGYQWQVVDRLLTNFHQPKSTLLALVAAFSDLESVRAAYQWAIQKKFKLFSYGDLSVWIKK